MFAHRGPFVLFVGAVACGAPAQSDPSARSSASAQQPGDVRRERCVAYAKQAAHMTRAMEGALEEKMDGKDLASAAPSIEREMLDKCMQWPDEVIDCLGLFGAVKPGCEEKLAEALGVAAPKLAADVPVGPAPAWTLELAGKPRALVVADDGTVVAIVNSALVGVRDGAVAWQVLDEVRQMLVVIDGLAVVARRERVIAIDPKDGRERWSVALPPLPDAEEYMTTPRPEVAAVAGDGLWIGDSEARFFRVDPDRCARNTVKKAAAGCLVAAGALVDEELGWDARLYVDAEGRRVLRETGAVRMFDAEWKATLTARAHDHLGAVALAPDGLVLVIDDDVVMLDPARCDGEFAPSGWPQPGVLYFKGGDECPECAAPRPGCRKWRVFVEGVTNEPPAVSDDGAVIVNVDGSTRALRAGKTAWETTTGGGGALLRIGDRVLGVSTGIADEDPLAVFELGIVDGVHRWRSPLPISLPGSIFLSDEIVLAHGGGWVIAGYQETIAALRRPE